VRYGIEVVPFGDYAEPGAVVELGVAAEAAGWEAISLWDHAHFWGGVGDPWVTLTAVATRTSRLRLVTGVSPVPRYRPHLLARALHALDALSGGRVVFGAGLGVPEDLDPLGDGHDAATRAAMTDEALPLVAQWCEGRTVSHEGPHYRAADVQVCPAPPDGRPPIWIGGLSGPALRRAARWEGWFAACIDEQQRVHVGPDRVAEAAAALAGHGARAGTDIAVNGTTEPGDPRGADLVARYAAAGATWWFESLFGLRAGHEDLLARVAAGPPAS
jgi:alkanesulfonate monooxygenase SsuD/methylene tetrahydromethanopterin reductase-like flavin-dependent oxidoreductase (luciferase family)